MTTIEQQDSFSPFLPRSRRPYTPRDTPRLFLWRKQAAPQAKHAKSHELGPVGVDSKNDNIPGSPVTSHNQCSSDGPWAPPPAYSRSLWLQRHAQKGLEGHLARLGSIDNFVRQETPNKNSNSSYYMQQRGAQRSLSKPEVWSADSAPLIFCPCGLPEECSDKNLVSSSPCGVPNSHLDPVVPRNESRPSLRPIERPAKVLVGVIDEKPRDIEAEIRIWLDKVSAAMMGDE